MTAPIPIVTANFLLGTAGGIGNITCNLTADVSNWDAVYVTLSTSYVQNRDLQSGFPVGRPSNPMPSVAVPLHSRQLHQRATRAVLADRSGRARQCGGRGLFVSHAGIKSVLICDVGGTPRQIPFAELVATLTEAILDEIEFGAPNRQP